MSWRHWCCAQFADAFRVALAVGTYSVSFVFPPSLLISYNPFIHFFDDGGMATNNNNNRPILLCGQQWKRWLALAPLPVNIQFVASLRIFTVLMNMCVYRYPFVYTGIAKNDMNACTQLIPLTLLTQWNQFLHCKDNWCILCCCKIVRNFMGHINEVFQPQVMPMVAIAFVFSALVKHKARGAFLNFCAISFILPPQINRPSQLYAVVCCCSSTWKHLSPEIK